MPTQPHIACIVLAAGRSTRMGAENKLLAELGGRPLVRHAAEAALASAGRPVIVVTGHQGAEVAAALAGLDLTLVANPDYAAGLSSSLKAGVRALPADCDGVVILLGDMPRITGADLDRLIGTFAPGAIVVPTHDGTRGNPVLWPAICFPELLQLEGDAGAKRLIALHADLVREIDLGTDAIFSDIDTPDALEQARRAQRSVLPRRA